MRRLLVLILVTLWPTASTWAQSTPPLSASRAVAKCRTAPNDHPLLWVQGFFVPIIEASSYVEGGLFPTSRVPPGTTNRWALGGRWKKYGALWAHIDTHASFGQRRLNLHGRLDCSSWRFVADRDPFPVPRLRPRYSGPAIDRRGRIVTSAFAAGIRLTVSIPAGPYPLDALVAVNVTLRNMTRHVVRYWTRGPMAPGYQDPQGEVLDSSGQVLYPPALPQWLPLPGPAPFPVPLRPGQSVGGRQFLVLRGPELRATQTIDIDGVANGVHYPPASISTRAIALGLISQAPPAVRLSASEQGLRADISPPAGATGPMFYMQYSKCGDISTSNQTLEWTASTPVLVPGCPRPVEWFVVAGWLNHPVARIHFVQSGQELPSGTASVGR